MSYVKAIGTGFLDFLEAVGIGVCLLLAGPLLLARRFEDLRIFNTYLRVFGPKHMVGTALRAELDVRLSNYERAAAVLNHLIRTIEEDTKDRVKRQKMHSKLVRLYTRLFRIYLLSGNIEAATLLVIRAHNHLGIAQLPDYPDFDVRTAHVVKAGIAAGRLLEEGGLATLFVRQGEEPVITGGRPTPTKSVGRERPIKVKRPDRGAKVIPFPLTDRPSLH